MPQGDDYEMNDPTPALEPVDETPAAPAPADDDAASAPADPEPPAPPPPGETPEELQRRSDRAFAAMRRANEAQAARIAALEARVAQTSAPPPAPVPVPPSTAPTPEQYPEHADFVRATAQWAVQQALDSQQAQTTANDRSRAWEAQEAQAKTIYADFDEALSADTTRYAPEVLHAIQTSEVGAALAYYLATHPDDAQRLSGLEPIAAVRALGRLEAQVQPPAAASPDPLPPPPPKPRPLVPVGGAGAQDSTVSPDQLAHEDYRAWWQKTYGSD